MKDYTIEKDGEIMYKLDRARILRDLPPELRTRTYDEFAGFMTEMVDYFIFSRKSECDLIEIFQRSLDRNSFSCEQIQDFRTYVDLFLKYWESWDLLTMETETYNPPSKDKEVVRKGIAEHHKRKEKKGT